MGARDPRVGREGGVAGIATRLFVTLLLLAQLAPLPARAQQGTFSQAELDQLLAPIALYPDPLLSQVLMASTYPLEVAMAANWSRENPNLQGNDALRAAAGKDWDPSVRVLVAFPQVLARMAENLEWTQALGNAFLAQEPAIMATVQGLRQRAQVAGSLQSSDELSVQAQGGAIAVETPNAQEFHVPYYDPVVTYGGWGSVPNPPKSWRPWPGYAQPRPYSPFWWGAAIKVDRSSMVERSRWRHDPAHRRGVKYASPAVQYKYVHAAPRRQDGRRRDDQQPAALEDPRFQLLMRPPDPRSEHVLPTPAQAQQPPTPSRPPPPSVQGYVPAPPRGNASVAPR